jgi:ABC-type nitrate/sulfonate/bicarbonate transport system ATPase subunit
MLELLACSARYGPLPVFDELSLSVSPPDVVAVVGPSGCGKTTLLMLMAGLKAPASGSVLLDGSPMRAGDPRAGLVLQQYGLFPWFTVEQNVELGLRLRGAPPSERVERARAVIARTGLAGLEGRYPAQLSGGQQQRVAIARTIVLEPELLLMDEPFASLDAFAREELQDLTLELLAARPMMTVLVTHSIEEAVYMSRTVLLMGRAGAANRIASRIDHGEPGRAYQRNADGYFEACRAVRQAFEANKAFEANRALEANRAAADA